MNFFIINREGSLRTKKLKYKFNISNNLLFFFLEFFDESEIFEIDPKFYGYEDKIIVNEDEDAKTEFQEEINITIGKEVYSEEHVEKQFGFILQDESVETYYIFIFYLAIIIKKGLTISNFFIKKNDNVIVMSETNDIST